MTKQKKKKSHVRDTWIPESWRYNGKGFQKDKSKEIERKRKYKKNYMKIYEVYLSKYKGLCYNEANELDAMLSFLSANSYEEIERIACSKKEALVIMDELKKLSKEEDFLP